MGFSGKQDKNAAQQAGQNKMDDAAKSGSEQGMNEGPLDVENSSGKFQLSADAMDGISDLKITDPETGEVRFDSKTSAIDSFGGNTISTGQSGMVEASSDVGMKAKKRLGKSARQAGKAAYNFRNIIPAHLREKEILDEVETGSLGIGLRLLDYNYSGPCIRIENADGEEYNIGFKEDDLDWNQVELFSRGLPVKLAAIFDQSGGGYSLTQTDSSKRPLVDLESRSVLFEGSEFLSGTVAPIDNEVFVMNYAYFEFLDQPTGNYEYVYRYGDTGAHGRMISLARYYSATATNNNKYYCYSGADVISGSQLPGQQWSTYTQQFSDGATTHELFVNGVSDANVQVYSNFGNISGTFVLGAVDNGNHFLDGSWRETVIYPRLLSSSERETVEAAAIDYWANLEVALATYEEIIATATGAFSLRKANPAYIGPALRVKFDNQSGTEFDIGFDGDGVDWTGLSAIFNSEGASEARVARLYNQMVDGGYISEATYSKMPVLLIQYKTMNFAGGQGLTGTLIDHVDAVSLVTAGIFLQLDQPDSNIDYFVMLGDQNNVNQRYMALARSSDGYDFFDNPKNSYYSVDRIDIFEGDVIEGFKGHVFAQVFEEGGAKQHRLYKNEIEDTTVQDYNTVGTITGLLNVGRHNSDNHHLMGNMNEILVFDTALSPEQVSIVSGVVSAYHGVYPVLDTQESDILEVTNPADGIKPLPFANAQFFEYEIYENGSLVETLTQSDPDGCLSLAPLGNLSLDTVYEARIRANLGNYVTMFGPPRSFRITSDVLFDPMLLGPSLWFDLQDNTQLLEDSLDSSKVMALINKAQTVATGNEALSNGDFTAFTNNQPDHWTITDASGGSNNLQQDSPLYIGQAATSPISMHQENLVTGRLYFLEVNTGQLLGEIQVRGIASEDVYSSITTSGLHTAYFVAKDKQLTLASAAQNTSAIILSVSAKEVTSLYAAQHVSNRQPELTSLWDTNFLRLHRSFTSNQDHGFVIERSSALENLEMSWAFVYRADSMHDAGQAGGIAKGLPWSGDGNYAYKIDFLHDSIRLYLWDGVADGSGNEHDLAQILIPDADLHLYQFSVSASEIRYSIDDGAIQSVSRQHGIDFSNQHNLFIGSRADGSFGMNGLLADVLYFDKALKDADMQFLAEGLIARNAIGKAFDPMPLQPAMWLDTDDDEMLRNDNSLGGIRSFLDKSQNLELAPPMDLGNYLEESFWTYLFYPNWSATPDGLVSDGSSGWLRAHAILTSKQTYFSTIDVTINSGQVTHPYSGWGSENTKINSSGTHTRIMDLHGSTFSLYGYSLDGSINSITMQPVRGVHVNERVYERQFTKQKIGLRQVMRGHPIASMSSLRSADLEKQEFSVIYVARPDDKSKSINGGAAMGTFFGSPYSYSWAFEFHQDDVVAKISDGSTHVALYSEMPDHGLHVYEMEVTGTHVRAYADGVEIGSTDRNGLQIQYSVHGLSLGTRTGESTSFEGDFGDVLYFDRPLAASEREELTKGLLSKYHHTWADLMLASYLSINKHAVYQQSTIDALEIALQPGGYYHETFGPDGQNKTRCDFLAVFELETGALAGGPSEEVSVKSGDVLRWEVQGAVYEINEVPAHLNNNNGNVAFLSTTDGWDGITKFLLTSQGFAGPLPHFELLNTTKFIVGDNAFTGTFPAIKVPNCLRLYAYINNFTGEFPLLDLPELWDLRLQYNEFSGNFPALDLPNCDKVVISNNQFSGAAPNFDFPLMEVVNISENQFSGAFPAINSPVLISLSAYENAFTSYTSQSWPDTLEYFYAQTNDLPEVAVDQILSDLTPNVTTRAKMRVLLQGSNSSPSLTGFDNQILLCENGHEVLTEMSWEYRMLANYVFRQSHGIYSAAVKAELLARLSSGYLYTTFGPSGQDKNECDFMYMFQFDTAVTSRLVVKNDGTDLLRWDTDGTVLVSNNSPTQSIGQGLGVITLSSTDGWDDITAFFLLDCGLTGTLPNLDWPNLSNFQIYDNNFSGQFPNLNLPSLQNLFITGNDFSGELPHFTAPNTRFFGASNNNFSGTCPNFDWPEVYSFAINGNNFSGTCPDWNFPELRFLSIHGNSFSGACPDWSYPILETIEMHDNDFSGAFPALDTPELKVIGAVGCNFSSYSSVNWTSNLERIRLEENQLDQTALDAILADLANQLGEFDHIIVNLEGTGNGEPSATGLAHATTLSEAGHQITLNADWTDRMMNDYLYRHSHGSYSAIVRSELLSRLSSGYLYDTFGPSGQNKSVCDFVFVMEFTGNLTSTRGITKTGDTLRWDIDGTETFSNNLLAQDFSQGAGIATLSTTDGWDGLTYMYLAASGMVGVIPHFDLPEVNGFHLFNNGCTSGIPAYDLPKCEYFRIRSNPFTGTCPNFNLPLVKHVELSYMTSLTPAPCPNFDFPLCEVLQINSNQFTGDSPVLNMPNLTKLYIFDNQFTGEIPDPNLPALEYYWAFGNDFSSFSGTDIGHAVQEFWLSENSFSQAEVDNIMAKMADDIGTRVPSQIWLHEPDMAAPSAAGYANQVLLAEAGFDVKTNGSWAQNMTANYLFRNSHGTYSQTAKDELLSRLSSGYLYDTFGPNGQAKTECDFVYMMEFAGNTVAPKIITKAGDQIRWDMDGTVSVDNRVPTHTFNGDGPTPDKGVCTFSVTDGWNGMLKFYIENNPFTGVLPNFDFPAVQRFSFFSNNFTGTCPNFNFPVATQLVGYHNEFSGEIPLFDLPELTLFYMSYCGFSGTCPLFDFPKVITFAINGNNFTGDCPSFILPEVRTVTIYKNNFSGAIPNFNFPTITTFYAHENNFSGTLPHFNFPLCTKFRIYENDFSGAFPALTMPNCTDLRIHRNNFSGNFPTISMAALVTCLISENSFTGPMPFLDSPNLDQYYSYANQFSSYAGSSIGTNSRHLYAWGNQLDQASVDLILSQVEAGIPNRSIRVELNLTGTSMAAPSAAGIADQHTLSEAGHYVRTNASWAENILADYLFRHSHGTYSQEAKDELLLRLSSGYLYDTFGPSGQDKTVCDFVYLLELGTLQTAGNSQVKTGTALRWDFEGNVTISNTMPVYTKQSNGVLTLSSEDGWDGVTTFRMETCNLKGLLPNFSFANVTSVWIRNNQFSGNLPVLNLPSVTGLYLSSNAFTGAFPIMQTPNLATLHIQYNELSGAFPDVDLPECTYLSAFVNNFTSLPTAAVNLPKVEYFHFGLNQITGSIPTYNFPMCEDFTVYGNQLTGNFPTLNMPNLRTLSLFSNQLSGTIPTVSLPNLVSFLVYGNDFTSIETQNLPMCTQFRIQSNDLTGTCPNFTLPLVTLFALENNFFTGEMPAFDFPECTTFTGGTSGFSGDFPAALNIPKIVNIQLFRNGFTGTFPTFNWPEVTYFQIYINNLTGIDHQNFPKCKTFRIDSNQITGTMPNFTLPLVETFWAGANQLSGTLPALNFPNCTHFYIHSNQFSGAFPAMNMPDCKIFHIADNAFSGALPALTLPSVTAFYIFDNSFSGNFPALSLPNVIEFRIWGNGFTGNMPDVTAASLLVYMTYDNSFTDYVGTDIPTSVTTYSLQNNTLSESAVNAVLAELAEESATRATCSINISGMTASGQGLSDIATLEGDGHSVTTG